MQPLVKNQSISLQVMSMDSQGQGVARHADGMTVFVQGALAGETVEARVIKVAKRYAVARLEQVLAPAPARVAPPCPYAGKCGGCTLQHMDYAEQLARKRQNVSDALARLGGFSQAQVLPVLGMQAPWHYRNKAQFPVAPGPAIGFYRRRTHDVIDMQACLLQDARSDVVLQVVRAFLARFCVQPYDERSGRGQLRHVMVRTNRRRECVVTLVVNAPALAHAADLVAMLRAALPGLRGVALNVNTRRDNVIMGEALTTLWGDTRLEETLLGLAFTISPLSFFQVNPAQTEVLYARARAFAALTGSETLWDIYCGAGTIGLCMARDARAVVGIESVASAVRDAENNARRNGIANASFIQGTAEDVLPRLVAQGQRADVAVLDPPRKGCDARLLDAVAKAAPARIVYVSCNPATLARDAAYLCARGYALGQVQPVDMFPHTEHVECVAQMVRA
nr:23S rRNA (uracil(1939)-C(5))-methyltransferase RlmD [Maliibacterium massiliense]